MSNDLLSKKCIPCEGGVEPLTEDEVGEYLAQVSGWSANDDATQIFKEFKFKNYVEAVVFITDIAHVAEEEDHHPDILLHSYKFVKVMLKTHAIGGLSENDFILAAKIDIVAADAKSS